MKPVNSASNWGCQGHVTTGLLVVVIKLVESARGELARVSMETGVVANRAGIRPPLI